jgi:hypothetical protein
MKPCPRCVNGQMLWNRLLQEWECLQCSHSELVGKWAVEYPRREPEAPGFVFHLSSMPRTAGRQLT